LFKEEEGGITNTIKASKDGLLELFYKDDEQSLSRQGMRMDGVTAPTVNVSIKINVQHMIQS
jgi:Holliday junction resolvase RusA-like endonuclease